MSSARRRRLAPPRSRAPVRVRQHQTPALPSAAASCWRWGVAFIGPVQHTLRVAGALVPAVGSMLGLWLAWQAEAVLKTGKRGCGASVSSPCCTGSPGVYAAVLSTTARWPVCEVGRGAAAAVVAGSLAITGFDTSWPRSASAPPALARAGAGCWRARRSRRRRWR